MEEWQRQVNEILANLHPTQIIEGIVKPAIKQIIDDYKDYLENVDEGENPDNTELNYQLMNFYKRTLKEIEDNG